jgi:hypothetical protein
VCSLVLTLASCRLPRSLPNQSDIFNKKMEAGDLQHQVQQMASHAAMASQMCAAMQLAKPGKGWANLSTLLHALSNIASAGARPELYQLLEVRASRLHCFPVTVEILLYVEQWERQLHEHECITGSLKEVFCQCSKFLCRSTCINQSFLHCR